MGWLFVALLVAMLTLFVLGLWLGSLRPVPRRDEQDPFVGVPMAVDGLAPRRVVVMRPDDDGVFRAS